MYFGICLRKCYYVYCNFFSLKPTLSNWDFWGFFSRYSKGKSIHVELERFFSLSFLHDIEKNEQNLILSLTFIKKLHSYIMHILNLLLEKLQHHLFFHSFYRRIMAGEKPQINFPFSRHFNVKNSSIPFLKRAVAAAA